MINFFGKQNDEWEKKQLHAIQITNVNKYAQNKLRVLFVNKAA